MRLYIPTVGTKIVLTQDWTFKLYVEYRNDTALDHFGITTVKAKVPDYAGYPAASGVGLIS